MKICFMLQRRFAYIGHTLASQLNQKYGIENFCGYVAMRKSFNFIKNKKSPRFSELILDEDIHRRYKTEIIDCDFIKKLEKDHGLPNLWPYIELDRIIRSNQHIRVFPYDTPAYSHEEMIKIVQVNAKAIIKFLDESKPDVLITPVIASIGSLMLYQMAKKRNIKTLIIHSARIGIKHMINEDIINYSSAINLFDKLQTNKIDYPEEQAKAIALLEKFRRQLQPYSLADLPKFRPINRRRQFIFLTPKKLIWSIRWHYRIIICYLTDPYRDDYTNINPFLQIWDNLKKKIRVLIGYGDLCDEIVPNEDFAYFPIHQEPENATLLYAPFYKDQLWLIKQMARSLPLNFKLYLKEHPTMHGHRLRRFYKELKKIPNIKLIKPEIESSSLIINAKLIFTISGTTGWEAVQLKKPIVVFSDVFYSYLPMVKKCVAIEQLPYLVKDQLENFKHDEIALINFLTAILHESVDADLAQLWDIEGGGQIENKKDQLTPLTDLIAKRLNLKPLKQTNL
ncbi:MAG: hypothetical protein Q7K35_02015 [bacterium]|nr:hypothetical protein [bacterium]